MMVPTYFNNRYFKHTILRQKKILKIYLDAVVGELVYLVHGSGGKELLRVGGGSHVTRVQEVHQLLSCTVSKPDSVAGAMSLVSTSFCQIKSYSYVMNHELKNKRLPNSSAVNTPYRLTDVQMYRTGTF